MKYQRIIQAAFGTPWAIDQDKLQAIVEFMGSAAFGMLANDRADRIVSRETPEPVKIQSGPAPQYARSGSVAILPVQGTIVPRANLMTDFSGGTSISRFRQSFRAAMRDDDIETILLDFDSPGGSVHQVEEMADEILASREVKPVVAQISILAASGGYWLASQASEINISPSAQVGSIGVLAMHVDWSRANEEAGINPTYITAGPYKAEGNPHEPLSEGARAHMQSLVNGYYDKFVSAVARGRRVSVEDVKGGYGKGRIYGATRALDSGMVDRVSTMDETMARLQPKKRTPTKRMRARTQFPSRVR